MTAQSPEIIIYQGRKLFSSEEPFSDMANKFKFSPGGLVTSLWRGYVGTWEVDSGCLFLISVNIPMSINENEIKYFFPHAHGRVFADWYSGTIKAYDEAPFFPRPAFSPTEWVILKVNSGVVEKEEYCKLNDEMSCRKRWFNELSRSQKMEYIKSMRRRLL